MKARLRAAHYDVRTSENVADALQPESRARAVLVRNRDASVLGQQIDWLLRRVRVPVIAICAPSQRLAALTAGAGFLLDHNCDDIVMRARLRSWLALPVCRETGFAESGAAFSFPDKIALLTDDAALARDWQSLLASVGLTISRISSRDGFARLRDRIAVLLVDAGAGSAGLQRLADLRARMMADARGTSLVMLQSTESAEEEARAFDMGAAEVLPVRPELCGDKAELAAKMQFLLRRSHEAERAQHASSTALRLARTDSLTDLLNRRALEHEIARTIRSGEGFGLVMADIDHFKSINDRYGHGAGDTVLREVGSLLTRCSPESARIARWGGEEFMLLLPRMDETGSVSLAENIRHHLAASAMRVNGLAGPVDVSVSVSVGICVSDDGVGAGGADELINRADAAMLAAKQAGRNRVILARPVQYAATYG
ncbi:GGDEF domain-containing protein [Paracoccus aerodenitrificans]|uniref:GGDEF domain-containing protein n=1 Tax=Paracoccus aerodenitrificans TaxID=3017781 RepID=UPI0022F014DA|nr:diguanylate cyclase [Paracoccus aerodenitrificans]WBU65523.1 diguanylate cyclase [Paracoccus aerodenitrificans]